MGQFSFHYLPKPNRSVEGQTVLEFILILLVIMSLSFVLLRTVNGGVADIWLDMIKFIADPTETDIQLI